MLNIEEIIKDTVLQNSNKERIITFFKNTSLSLEKFLHGKECSPQDFMRLELVANYFRCMTSICHNKPQSSEKYIRKCQGIIDKLYKKEEDTQ